MTQEQKPEQTLPEVKPTETVSPSGVTTQKTEPGTPTTETKPLAPEVEARLQQMIAEATARTKAEAIEQGKTLGRREMQSIKDKEVADALRRARLAETEAASFQSGLDGLDDEAKLKIENSRLRGRDQFYQTQQREEDSRRQQETYVQNLKGSLHKHLEDLGIDPQDKRVDWAEDAGDFLSGRSRFDTSVAKILKETSQKKASTLKKELDDRLLAMEVKLGLHSTDNTAGGGVSNDGIPTDPDKFKEWITNIPQKEYEEKYAAKVKEMQRQGKI